jgi:hypothetical protein
MTRRRASAFGQVIPRRPPGRTRRATITISSRFAFFWAATKAQGPFQAHPDWFKPGGLVQIVGREGNLRNLPPDVPSVDDYLSARSKELLLLSELGVGDPLSVPAGTHPEALAVLRQAFETAVKDPDLKSATEKQNVLVNPVSADDLKGVIQKLFATPAEIVDEFKVLAGLK